MGKEEIYLELNLSSSVETRKTKLECGFLRITLSKKSRKV